MPAESTAGLLVQMVTGPGGVTTAGGGGITVTVSDAVAVQPLTSVTVTVNVPEEFTLSVAAVELSDQRKEVPPLAVRITCPPWQNVSGPPGLMTGVGFGFTVTDCGADVPVHPFASVTVTVNVPLAVTLITCVVEEVFHKYVPTGVAVKLTEPPAQKTVGPSGTITGTGFGFTVTQKLVVAEHPSTEYPVTV